jgi:putative membrane protein
MAIGLATLVPGVSGGTMAIILGVYDKLIHAISSYFHDWKNNTILLLEIGVGGILGIGLFSKLLENAIKDYPAVMQFLFIGVILGGLPTLYKKSISSGKRSMADFLFLIIGFVTVLLLSSEPSTVTDMATAHGLLSMVFLFVAGVIIAIALELPGISGSFMLLALGLYGVTLNAINTINITFLIPLGLGIVVGTLGTTTVIEKMLQKFPGKTYMLIMGFVLGSIIPVFPGIPSGMQLLASIATFAFGLAAILWLGSKGLTD